MSTDPRDRGHYGRARRVCASAIVTLALLVGASVEAVADPVAASAPRLGGYVQVRETVVRPTGLSASLNRARLSGDGVLPQHFSYRVLVEYESGGAARTAATVALRDAYIRWSLAPCAVNAGQFKTPFSREYTSSITVIETADRSTVVDTLAPKRDVGIMVEFVKPLAGVWLGVFNGEGQNSVVNRDSTVLVVGRASVRPISQITLAGSVASYGPDSTRWGADASLEQSGFVLRGEWLTQHKRDRARDDAGWFVLAGYRIVPWLQVIARQEDFQRPGIGVTRRISATTGGLNIDLPGGRTRGIIDFVSRQAGFPRVRTNSLVAQLQVKF
ncbi:MAG TPA: porin [Candidatus Saccharimonadaceae bacterium]|nr:porin [Candidatus Saccharimonadaceae bacterium]